MPEQFCETNLVNSTVLRLVVCDAAVASGTVDSAIAGGTLHTVWILHYRSGIICTAWLLLPTQNGLTI